MIPLLESSLKAPKGVESLRRGFVADDCFVSGTVTALREFGEQPGTFSTVLVKHSVLSELWLYIFLLY